MRTSLACLVIVPALLTALASPAPATPSKCSAAKMKAAGKKAYGKAKCWSKAFAKDHSVDSGCLSKAEVKFSAAFAKAELFGDCYTMGDEVGIEGVVDTCVNSMVSGLGPTTTTTSSTTTTTMSSCVNGIKDGTETDVDCGGGACPPCGNGKMCAVGSDCTSGVCFGITCVPTTCINGVQDGTETDVDCGGVCPACPNGKNCFVNSDCTSANCSANQCQP